MKILFLILLVTAFYYSVSAAKAGRCKSVDPSTNCKGSDECEEDGECSGSSKCCSNGCIKTCSPALQSPCDLQRSALEGQVRALNPEDAMSIILPKCRENDGLFEEIQCNSDKCWCVNPETGYEIYDTRVKKGEKIDCKNGQGKCLGPTCRMFCDHGFSLDENGCQLCKCFNPCQNVKCPGSTECETKTVDCTLGKCSVPSCRKPRTLDSLCPIGSPLLAEGGESPLLCGIEEYKPQCPGSDYKCSVEDGRDYGTCCPFKAKMGKCPINYSHSKCDGETCSSDLDCFGNKKCCSSSNCGSVCVEPVNNTLCFQQKEIAEHRFSRTFIPRCSETGEFVPKQCSDDKNMCWCVDNKGLMIDDTMKSSKEVQCGLQGREEKVELPLADRSLPKKNPCKIGLPLIDKKTGDVLLCGSRNCPGTYECTKVDPNLADTSMVCCATTESIVKTKLGECPEFIPEPRFCPIEKNGTCVSDSHCPDDLHCCPSLICGSLCTDADIDSLPKPNQLPTTCEYLRNLKRLTGSSPSGRSLAVHSPRCKKNGIWDVVQCTREECWCVDEFGVEISGTRGKYEKDFDCRQARENDVCDGALCRLACDYGFKKGDDGCPICDCRDPCDDTDCGNDRTCVVRAIDCGTTHCPPVATCEPKKGNLVQTCPKGSTPLVYDFAIITCDNNYFRCPENFTCQGNTEMALGLCCSISGNAGKEGECPATGRSVVDICAEQCQTDTDCSGPQKCCVNGCGAHVCVEPLGTATKPGQCPYIISDSSMSCDFECSSDYDCTGSEKCCSNGCGTACIAPKSLTACQHMTEIAEHRGKLSRANRLRSRAPSCTNKGEFEPIQCDKLGSTCWCVDNSGKEVSGTRVGPGQAINCDAPKKCTELDCKLNCLHGLLMDENGCPTCECKDPCQDVTCSSKKECRIVKVQCITQPCSAVAMCLPKLSNPCSLGEPLKEKSSNNYLQCGPMKNQCPSSHACNMSPFGEYSVCCPKPKSTCEQERSPGTCRAALPRWYFDSETNTCKKFKYGGCGGNLNNFQSQGHCKETCPTMTPCQVKKRKSRRLRNFFSSNIAFKPRCQAKSGKFNNIQCMGSFGLCWCVDRKGAQLPGTLVRGTPKCSTRGGRTLDETPICKNGESVNVCKESHCNGMVCEAYPNAVCRINPCGSCKAEFYDENGDVVDCSQGLTDCEREHQEVINSHRYRVQLGIISLLETEENELPSSSESSRSGKKSSSDAILPAKMTISPFLCKSDGEFQPVQTQNKLSWCVNKFGEAKHKTLSIGEIECDAQGSIIRKENQLPVCPNSNIPPRVCNDACINSHCPSHPDAICLADACSNCEISFVNVDGKEVNCGSKCVQPMKEGGCNDPSVRYYYNQAKEQCEEFSYNGCDGNDNNFVSKESCNSECTKPVPVCEQPADIGICRMNDRRWFYNKNTQKCEEFIFGGCKGNENNFLTKQACEARCPDIVVCPWNDIRGDNEIEPCSRDKACAEINKCSYPGAVCTVNPCSCEAIYVDVNGQAVSCDANPDEPNYIFDGTRCDKIREEQYKTGSNFQVGCDKDGKFLPIQCDKVVKNEEKCWCVDESGNRLPNLTTFIRGERKCEFVPVERVNVELLFKHEGKLTEDQIPKLKSSLNEILSAMAAETSDDLDVKSSKGSTAIHFTLIGDNKINTAYHLEKMIKETGFKLHVDDQVLKGDYSSSKFQHLHASSSSTVDETEEDEGLSKNTVALIVIFTILGILAIFAVVAAVLIYRRRVRKYSPKQQSASLAFDSPVYGLSS